MKSKSFRLLSFTLLAAAASVAWPVHAAKVRVVTTLTDLADFARELGGDHVDVFSLATGVEDTHGVPMKPSFVPLMNRADMLVHAGFGLDQGGQKGVFEASKNRSEERRVGKE